MKTKTATRGSTDHFSTIFRPMTLKFDLWPDRRIWPK